MIAELLNPPLHVSSKTYTLLKFSIHAYLHDSFVTDGGKQPCKYYFHQKKIILA